MAVGASVFDSFPWWDSRDVLTQITPARFAYIRSVSGPLRGRRLLDLGCGAGHLSEPLARAGACVTGVDISEPALVIAREHARRSGLRIEYRQAPAEHLPFAGASFDLVVAFDALEHFDDLGRAIAEVARVLRPSGRFIYDTMNRTLFALVSAIWIGETIWPGGPPKGTHQWRKFIRPAELAAHLERNGIRNAETRGFFPVGVDRYGHLKMRLAPIKWLSYVGYGVRNGSTDYADHADCTDQSEKSV